jgi:hypothetical protein
MNTPATSGTEEHRQALIETAKKINPATLGKAGGPIAAGAELPHMKGHDVDTAHVNPELQDVLNRASQYLPKGYHAEVQSGFRRGDPRFHERGMAEDIAIFGPDGKPLPNYQSGANFRAYEQFAQNARKIQHDLHHDLDNKLRWGGYFGGAKGK